jgi:hypothetical protein
MVLVCGIVSRVPYEGRLRQVKGIYWVIKMEI